MVKVTSLLILAESALGFSLGEIKIWHVIYGESSVNIGACRPGHTRALPGLFRITRIHITRTGREDPPHIYITHAQTYV